VAEATRLSGTQKAAILMLVAGPEQAGRLYGRLDLDEIKDITQQMSTLGRVRVELVEAMLAEFRDRCAGAGGLVGSYEVAEQLLSGFLAADKVAAIMEEIRGPAGRNVWEKLGHVDEAVLAAYLKSEYPQTVAVVLSRIRPDHAARVLAELPRDLALDAIMRMLRMEVVQKDILNDVEDTLRNEFMSNLARTQRRDHHEVMAEIFNYFDRSTETAFLGLLEERNKEAADRIRSLMFTFEDLVKLDGPAIQALLRAIDPGKLGLALKGASEPLRELFLRNMSERAAKILRDDMETMGPVRVRDVDAAQNLLVTQAKELAAAGEIVIADTREEEMIY
jgi:flagellar motor switch protein FliG